MTNIKLSETKQKIKQINQQMNRIQKEKEKLENQLTRQHEREQLKLLKEAQRKRRNHNVYQWGALIPLVFGTEEFDLMFDNFSLKALFVGLIIEIKNEIEEIKINKNTSIDKISYFNLSGNDRLQRLSDSGKDVLLSIKNKGNKNEN